ncbi:hypothetical protein, partial [Aliiruegeria lutimaris]|uniref:hypothetical protein n=1 Tax=Aliiruegeria lutimaris TaxID=571298 RepID=UPI001BB0738D
IENHDLSHTPHRLWFNRHAQFQISEGRRLLKSTGHNAYRQKARTKPDEFANTSPTNPTCPVRSRATERLKSP